MNFIPFPTLETERLLLRRILHSDANDIFIIRSDVEVMRYIPRPIAKSINDVIPLIELIDKFIQNGERINWAIELKQTKQVIGIIGFVNLKLNHFRAEVGYSLAAKYQRKGIMSEALSEIVAYGFEDLKLHTIEAIVDDDNKASKALLENFGFIKEALFREDFYHNTSFRNSVHYGLLASDLKKFK